jgi:glycosyltransferase involved in cell wall biosynthesis/LmbE family N-acetylglucosaminyl deacetylase
MLSIARGTSPAILEQSIIVAAHPDDEVLWFSSILDRVNKVVVCYIGSESNPWWGAGRRKSLAEYPIKTISSLNVDQSDVFNAADWKNPVITDYGLEIVNDSCLNRKDKYRNNFGELRQQLEKQLDGYRNVFTHNPWGEYGHEEHVQVYRVIKGLQSKMKFNLWYSNYVSNKSFDLMMKHINRFCFEYVAFEPNKILTADVQGIYEKNKCWTWYEDWECFKEEVFIKERVSQEAEKWRGRLFPTNLIKVGLQPLQRGKASSYFSVLDQRIRKAIKEVPRRFGIEITRYTPDPYEQVISLEPENKSQGDMLLSYRIEPFLLKPGEPIQNSHTHYWESWQIARTFLDLGYSVDVIHARNKTFQPKKNYSYFIGHRINFDRIAGLLKGDCVKIAHLDTAHWIVNNYSTYQRKFELQQRRGLAIKESHRLIEPNLAIESADYAVTYGNQFTFETYRHAKKPLFRVPISTCALFPSPENKNFGACRSNFLWFGSGGFVHKGLDLVLEAFAEMPDYHLYVCGPLEKEKDFARAYSKELYQTPNIHTIGWVDVEGAEFAEIANRCLGLVYVSCSEAGGGSVITCMHAGLIPLVSYESSVDVGDFGVVVKGHSVNAIKSAIQMVSQFPVEQLQKMAQKSWEYARVGHTREKFAEEYKKVILGIMNIRGSHGAYSDGLRAMPQ